MTTVHIPEDDIPQQVRSFTELWNRLYGDVMYRIMEPKPGEPAYRLVSERIREHGYDDFSRTVMRIGRSRYLLGLQKRAPMSLIWFLQAPNFQKVLQGAYDDYRSFDDNTAYPSANAKDGLQRDTDLDRMVLEGIIRRRSVSPG